MVRLLLCVQVVDGADLLSERTETEDKKLNKVCLLLFSSAPQFKASICSPVQASLQSLWPGPVARTSCQGQLPGPVGGHTLCGSLASLQLVVRALVGSMKQSA